MYSKPITHLNRGAIVIAVDCSMSMQEHTFLNNISMSKIEAVAVVCNYLIDELLERATRHGEVRNYYDIAVVGYANKDIVPIIPEYCDRFIPISELSNIAPKIKEWRFGDSAEDPNSKPNYMLRDWIRPMAHGETPMHTALTYIYTLLERWCSKPENQNSFPPIVFNITDGEATDATNDELIDISRQIQTTSTNDGNTLLINILLSRAIDDTSVIFPSDRDFFTETEQMMTLFRMSRIMPESMNPLIEQLTTEGNRAPYRGVAYNVSPDKLLAILNIGSESINLA